MPLRTGTVESIRYAGNAASHQWTTIDGVIFATWLDPADGIGAGSLVRYEPFAGKIWDTDTWDTACAIVSAVPAMARAALA